MRIAAVQLEITPSRETNINNALIFIEEAFEHKAELIVLPEAFNTGFFPENYGKVENLENELKPILKLSKNKKAIIVGGVVEKESDKLYNSSVLIYNGKIIGKYRKTKLFPLSNERKYFSPGNEFKVFNTGIGNLGVLICYEIRFPEISRELTKMGAEIIIAMAEFPEERIEHWVTLLRARAIENQLFVVGVNCVGGDKGYPGRSAIIDPLGNILAKAGNSQEIIFADVDLNMVKEVRKKFPFLED
ncbi:MAG: carbon-nitrogen family hydrolase [Candidatus Hydrothermarchaeota archaeon]|nr:MAG: carbon-nitrogen family hydrolase [Candidatus Hydrothermarchaeota archaeon]